MSHSTSSILELSPRPTSTTTITTVANPVYMIADARPVVALLKVQAGKLGEQDITYIDVLTTKDQYAAMLEYSQDPRNTAFMQLTYRVWAHIQANEQRKTK